MIIESLVFPHLTYCMTVWAGCGTTQRRRIQRVMNHCAQIVKGCRRSAHVSAILQELRWPSVDNLVSERDLALMHCIQGVPKLMAPYIACNNMKTKGDKIMI